MTVLILHDQGAADGGQPWREAFEATGHWTAVLAPDLPGHGAAEPPLGGHYDATDAGFEAARLFATGSIDRVDTVVGVGLSGWSAQIVALAGRADYVVLVDGLGDPFLTAEERLDRRIAHTQAMVAGADPMSLPFGHGSRELAEKAAAQMPVPILLLGGDPAMASALQPTYPDASVVDVEVAAMTDVAAATAAWRAAR